MKASISNSANPEDNIVAEERRTQMPHLDLTKRFETEALGIVRAIRLKATSFNFVIWSFEEYLWPCDADLQ